MINSSPPYASGRRLFGFLGLSFLLLAVVSLASAKSFEGSLTRFSPDEGQPIFPLGNLNVFKQYVFDIEEAERLNASVGVDFGFFEVKFGGDVAANVKLAAGLEVGLCVGGNADFDLAFKPTITIPDKFPTEIPVPLTVSSGLRPDSYFTTTFPPLGKAYADLVFELGAGASVDACVFGCVNVLDFQASTGQIRTGDGNLLFPDSLRCDPAQRAEIYNALELVSFNRNDDNKLRLLNVKAKNKADFFLNPYIEKGGTNKEFNVGSFGSVSIAAPTVNTDSMVSPIDDSNKPFTVEPVSDRVIVTALPGFRNGNKVRLTSVGGLPDGLNEGCVYYIKNAELGGLSCQLSATLNGPAVDIRDLGFGTHRIALRADFNTAEMLKSTGAEDVFGVSLNVLELVSPLGFPLSDSGSSGPASYDYTIASMSMGPAVQLQTDFEMTWDLLVTNMSFSRPVIVEGSEVTSYAQVASPRVIHLTNSGEHALPLVQMIDEEEVEVTINYVLKPKLKTVVSAPFIGRVEYAALGAHASIDKVGELGFGPILKGEHNFKAADFNVYRGNPSSIESGDPDSDYDLDRYEIELVNVDEGEVVPTVGCALLVVSLSGGNLGIRIFDTTGEIAADLPAASLLHPESLAALTDAVTPWPRSALVEIERKRIMESGTDIIGYEPGVIKFPMKAAGKPSFVWTPSQLDGATLPAGFVPYQWSTVVPLFNSFTYWLEVAFSNLKTGFPGNGGGRGSHATISSSPFPTLYMSVEVDSLKVTLGAQLTLDAKLNETAASLTINGGMLENRGLIMLNSGSSIRLSSPDSILCAADGTLLLSDSDLLGYEGTESSSFVNMSDIFGSGTAMDQYSNAGDTLFENHGTVGAIGSSVLLSSARRVINHGRFSSTDSSDYSVYGDVFESRNGSVLQAAGDNSFMLLSFSEAEHGGDAIALQGGMVSLGPLDSDRSIWYAGQAFSPEVGRFCAIGEDSTTQLIAVDMVGGRFEANDAGKLEAENSSFTGSLISIGDFDPDDVDPSSGSFELFGENSTFTKSSLINYGTVVVHGESTFVDNLEFSNNGTVLVTAGSKLHILEVGLETDGVGSSPELTTRPGTANASKDLLIGGTWDISGELLIDGAHFLGTGANIARVRTSSGSSIVTDAGVVMDTDDEVVEDLSLVLSLGRPAEVKLRGPSWSFPAIDDLRFVGGKFSILDGASFPGGNTGATTTGDFLNQGTIFLTSSSVLRVGGDYLQLGGASRTGVYSSSIESSTGTFIIKGGRFEADAGSNPFKIENEAIPSGMTIHIESPYIETDEFDPILQEIARIQEPAIVTLDPTVKITHIAEGAEVTLVGAEVTFANLTDNLDSNAGTFNLDGEIVNRGIFSLSQVSGEFFSNTGTFNLLGYGTEFTAAGLLQTEANAVTRIGAGAQLRCFGPINVNDGEIVMEIGTRPNERQFATIVGSDTVAFNKRLVVDFTGELAETGPELGDRWELMTRTNSVAIVGAELADVTFKLNGETLPSDWLPEGSHIEMRRYDTEFGQRGLSVYIAPDVPFISYYDWAEAEGFPREEFGFLVDPYQDMDNDTFTNIEEFLMGEKVRSDRESLGFHKQTVVTGDDGHLYIETSFERPSGVDQRDALYIPFYSEDLVDWFVSFEKVAEVAQLANPNLADVTYRSIYPVGSQNVFSRYLVLLNPDEFPVGSVPAKPFGDHPNSLERLGYQVGQVLFINVNARADAGSVYGDGSYHDTSSLPAAAVHAGVLNDGDSAVVKVTIMSPLANYVGTKTNENTGNQVTSQSLVRDTLAEGEVSYKIERID